MYRVYELTDKEKDKITRLRWDCDTHQYDVFESQEECDKEQERLDKIEKEYKEEKSRYTESLKQITKRELEMY